MGSCVSDAKEGQAQTRPQAASNNPYGDPSPLDVSQTFSQRTRPPSTSRRPLRPDLSTPTPILPRDETESTESTPSRRSPFRRDPAEVRTCEAPGCGVLFGQQQRQYCCKKCDGFFCSGCTQQGLQPVQRMPGGVLKREGDRICDACYERDLEGHPHTPSSRGSGRVPRADSPAVPAWEQAAPPPPHAKDAMPQVSSGSYPFGLDADQSYVPSSPVAMPSPPHGTMAFGSALDKSSSLWQPDSKNCSRCGDGFSLTHRRHHCRRCGSCVCGSCSEHALNLTPVDGGRPRKFRVCEDCFITAVAEKGGAHGRQTPGADSIPATSLASSPPVGPGAPVGSRRNSDGLWGGSAPPPSPVVRSEPQPMRGEYAQPQGGMATPQAKPANPFASDISGISVSTAETPAVAAVPKEEWAMSDACHICSTRFGFINRRHHCRSCGISVCAACSPGRTRLANVDDANSETGSQVGSSTPSLFQRVRGKKKAAVCRVCTRCFQSLQEAQQNHSFEVYMGPPLPRQVRDELYGQWTDVRGDGVRTTSALQNACYSMEAAPGEKVVFIQPAPSGGGEFRGEVVPAESLGTGPPAFAADYACRIIDQGRPTEFTVWFRLKDGLLQSMQTAKGELLPGMRTARRSGEPVPSGAELQSDPPVAQSHVSAPAETQAAQPAEQHMKRQGAAAAAAPPPSLPTSSVNLTVAPLRNDAAAHSSNSWTVTRPGSDQLSEEEQRPPVADALAPLRSSTPPADNVSSTPSGAVVEAFSALRPGSVWQSTNFPSMRAVIGGDVVRYIDRKGIVKDSAFISKREGGGVVVQQKNSSCVSVSATEGRVKWVDGDVWTVTRDPLLLGLWTVEATGMEYRIEPEGRSSMTFSQWLMNGELVHGQVHRVDQASIPPKGFAAEWVVDLGVGRPGVSADSRDGGTLWMQRCGDELRTAHQWTVDSEVGHASAIRAADVQELGARQVCTQLWVCPPSLAAPGTSVGWLGPVTESLRMDGIEFVALTDDTVPEPPASSALLCRSFRVTEPMGLKTVLEFIDAATRTEPNSMGKGVVVCGEHSPTVAAAYLCARHRCESVEAVRTVTEQVGEGVCDPIMMQRDLEDMWPTVVEAQQSTAAVPVAEMVSPGEPGWVPDAESNVCQECGSKFSFTRRRHHCRHCGHLFCSACSKQQFMLKPRRGGKPQKARVCGECYSLLLHRQEDGASVGQACYSGYSPTSASRSVAAMSIASRSPRSEHPELRFSSPPGGRPGLRSALRSGPIQSMGSMPSVATDATEGRADLATALSAMPRSADSNGPGVLGTSPPVAASYQSRGIDFTTPPADDPFAPPGIDDAQSRHISRSSSRQTDGSAQRQSMTPGRRMFLAQVQALDVEEAFARYPGLVKVGADEENWRRYWDQGIPLEVLEEAAEKYQKRWGSDLFGSYSPRDPIEGLNPINSLREDRHETVEDRLRYNDIVLQAPTLVRPQPRAPVTESPPRSERVRSLQGVSRDRATPTEDVIAGESSDEDYVPADVDDGEDPFMPPGHTDRDVSWDPMDSMPPPAVPGEPAGHLVAEGTFSPGLTAASGFSGNQKAPPAPPPTVYAVSSEHPAPLPGLEDSQDSAMLEASLGTPGAPPSSPAKKGPRKAKKGGRKRSDSPVAPRYMDFAAERKALLDSFQRGRAEERTIGDSPSRVRAGSNSRGRSASAGRGRGRSTSVGSKARSGSAGPRRRSNSSRPRAASGSVRSESPSRPLFVGPNYVGIRNMGVPENAEGEEAPLPPSPSRRSSRRSQSPTRSRTPLRSRAESIGGGQQGSPNQSPRRSDSPVRGRAAQQPQEVRDETPQRRADTPKKRRQDTPKRSRPQEAPPRRVAAVAEQPGPIVEDPSFTPVSPMPALPNRSIITSPTSPDGAMHPSGGSKPMRSSLRRREQDSFGSDKHQHTVSTLQVSPVTEPERAPTQPTVPPPISFDSANPHSVPVYPQSGQPAYQDSEAHGTPIHKAAPNSDVLYPAVLQYQQRRDAEQSSVAGSVATSSSVAFFGEAKVEAEWENANTCFLCTTKFGMLKRRHHCRKCARSACEKCSRRTLPLRKPQSNRQSVQTMRNQANLVFALEVQDVRVCDSCFFETATASRMGMFAE
eukprot:Hpha_TRINITY_DN16018_c3_g1::TRINITY_DN16018_c3_g1_i2::g.118178::m.118178